MNKKWIYFTGFCALIMLLGWGIFQPANIEAGARKISTPSPLSKAYNYTDQLIVKYRNPAFVRNAARNKFTSGAMINERVSSLNASASVELRHARFMSGDGHVLKLPRKMTLTEAKAVASKLNAAPNVLYAQPDRRVFPMLEPDDPLYISNQWHYKAPATEIGGVNLPLAWDHGTGLASIVVAVIDTGIVAHADLTRTVAGYDFISNAIVANDGGGRDANPADPGDWVTEEESNDEGSVFYGCDFGDSSWHGTHVAGTIGANTDNTVGVAGINWVSNILPVRVLGKCFGYDSDIIDGMRWAAGLAVTGVPANANPAKVLNLSLGGLGACDTATQEAIDDVLAAGATVVVAAGNDSLNVSGFSPANCTGVISVAATNRAGGRADYSNYGSLIKIAAPGGDTTPTEEDGVYSTFNTGTTSPVASPGGDTYKYYDGTSMAAPHVAGIASLMLSENPALLPAQVLSLIQSTARLPFPTGTGLDCNLSTCGSGIIDADAAVTLVESSVADSADLALANTDSTPTTPPLLVGTPFNHTITVTNNDATNSAVATVVTYIQSGTATIGSASATPSPSGTCTGTSFVSCNLGTLAAGASATVYFEATPLTTGTVIHTAAVSSALTDPVPADNSWVFNTTAENPEPVITSLSPASRAAGGAAFTLTLNGTGFTGDSTVQWGGVARTTTFISFTQLTAAIFSTDIATAGTRSVTVVNPTPGGGTSDPAATFTVTAAAPAADATGGWDSSGCFIATAAFGSPLERHVQILRDFRDSYLLNFNAGKAFVKFYYEVSPPIAQIIAQSEVLRLLTRVSLMPVIGVAYLILHFGPLSALLMMLFGLAMLGVLIRITRKKLNTARQKAEAFL